MFGTSQRDWASLAIYEKRRERREASRERWARRRRYLCLCLCLCRQRRRWALARGGRRASVASWGLALTSDPTNVGYRQERLYLDQELELGLLTVAAP